MKQRLLLLLFAAILLLSACTTTEPPATTPTDATTDPVAADTMPVDTTPPTDPVAETKPSGDPGQIIKLSHELVNGQKYYSRFLGFSRFSSVDDPCVDLNLHLVFSQGLQGVDDPDTVAELTEQERQLLFANYPLTGEFYRLTPKEVVPVLVEYLGVDEEKAMELAVNDPGMNYLEETDCFYPAASCTEFHVSVWASYEQADGNILVCYRNRLLRYYGSAPYSHVAVLRREGDGYVILSVAAADATEDMAPAETTPEFSGRLLSQQEGAQLEWELRSESHYYGTLLGATQFTSLDDPEAVMWLYMLFADGIRGGESPDTMDELTEEERELLYGEEPNAPTRLYRMAREDVVAVFMDYLGVDEEKALALALDELQYLEETDCFYMRESYSGFQPGIYAAYEQEDGTILICYRDMLKAEMESTPYTHVAVLRPREGGYCILSNVPAQP